LVRLIDPAKDPTYVWNLMGPLRGMVLRPGCSEALQYVVSEAAYEPAVTAALQQLVRPGMVCVDVGANIGYFTLLFARSSGETGRVYAFEALPENAALLNDNVELNGLGRRVVVEAVAVGDGRKQEVHLYRGSSTLEYSIVGESAGIDTSSSVAVPAVSLDAYFADGPRVDVIKMDIEGAEEWAFRGMQRMLSEDRPRCVVELHGDAGMSVIEVLLGAGYVLEDLEGSRLEAATNLASIRHVVAIPAEAR
jgi:FkbM family methyltransferase